MPEKFPLEPSPEQNTEQKKVEEELLRLSKQEQLRKEQRPLEMERELLSKGWEKISAKPESIKSDTDEAEERLEEKYLKKYRKSGFDDASLVPKNEGASKGPYLYDIYMRTPEAAEKEKEKQKEIRKQLEAALGQPLKEKKFLKERSNWRRELKDVIDVLNLQKSQFSDSYMINLGTFLKKQKDLQFTDWLPRTRIEELLPKEDWKEIWEALDFNATPDIESARKQIKIIREAVEKYAIPFFESRKK